MADVGAEFLFQVVAERAEKAAVIMTRSHFKTLYKGLNFE